jgi:hypothetical protein
LRKALDKGRVRENAYCGALDTFIAAIDELEDPPASLIAHELARSSEWSSLIASLQGGHSEVRTRTVAWEGSSGSRRHVEGDRRRFQFAAPDRPRGRRRFRAADQAAP